MTDAAKKPRNKKSRNYPTFGLEEAIGRARILQGRDGFSWIHQDVACRHWNLSPTSSTGRRALSALIQYGLLDTQGKSKTRQVRLSGNAKRILHPDASMSKAEAFKESGLKPAIFRELWEAHAGGLPSDDTLKFNLTQDGDFNNAAAEQVIETYKATIEFAGLTKGLILEAEGDDNPTDNHDEQADPPSRPSSVSEGSNPMPATTAPNRKDFDLPIQLSAGLQGTLRLPVPMTSVEWGKFETAIESVKQLKTFLVSDDPQEDSREGRPDSGTEAGS